MAYRRFVLRRMDGFTESQRSKKSCVEGFRHYILSE
jgi:hypothetical protein